MRGLLALSAVAILSACVSPGVSPAQRSEVSFQPDALGLQVSPIGKRVDFGRSPDGVIAALDREVGRHQKLPLAGCPSNIARQLIWDDLVLTFTSERFVGWRNAESKQGLTCA